MKDQNKSNAEARGRKAEAKGKALSDEALLRAITEDPSLSEHSKAQYHRQLMRLQALGAAGGVRRPLVALLSSPSLTMERILSCVDASRIHARHALVTAVLATFKRVAELGRRFPNAARRWQRALLETEKPIREHELSNQPSERQRRAVVSLEEVVAKSDGLPAGSFERLLLCTYGAELPPVRRDVHDVPIRFTPAAAAAADSGAEQQDKKHSRSRGGVGNYVVVSPEFSHGVLVLNEYKTAKHFKRLEIAMTAGYLAELKASLSRYPRSHLFVANAPAPAALVAEDEAATAASSSSHNGARSGGWMRLRRPFKSEASFGQWANRTLRRVFDGRPVTLTMLRHAYVTGLFHSPSFSRLSDAELIQIHRQMGHSAERARAYRFVQPPMETATATSQCRPKN
jgi:hypothetical protein